MKREQVVGVRRIAASALLAALVAAIAVLWLGASGAGATCSPGRSGDHPNNGHHYGHDRRDHCRPPATTTPTPAPTVATTVPATPTTATSPPTSPPPPAPPGPTPVQGSPTTTGTVAVDVSVAAAETAATETPAGTTGDGPADYVPPLADGGGPPTTAQVLGITQEPPGSGAAVADPAAVGSIVSSSGTGASTTTVPPEDRSNVATGLPESIDLSPAWVASNLGLGSLVLLVLLAAAQLFNDTLKTHHARLVARLSDRSTILGRAQLALASLPHAPPLVSFAVIAGTLGLLADPSVALSLNTVAQVLGMSVGVALIVGVYDGTASRTVNRQTGIARGYRLYPIAIAVAVGCLALSRVFDIAPGVLYGLIAGVVYAGTVDRRLEGRAYALSSVLLMLAALGAYLVHRMVTPSAAGADPSFWVIVVDTAAAALFVGGLQAVIVQLLPVRYVNGEKISDWSRVGWFALLAVALGLYLQFVVRPNPDQQTWGNLWFVAGLVSLAVLFWLWCTLSPTLRDTRPAAAPGPAPDHSEIGSEVSA